MHRIAHIPSGIIQGALRHDLPAASAFALKAKWPKARLTVVPKPGVRRALVGAWERLTG